MQGLKASARIKRSVANDRASQNTNPSPPPNNPWQPLPDTSSVARSTYAIPRGCLVAWWVGRECMKGIGSGYGQAGCWSTVGLWRNLPPTMPHPPIINHAPFSTSHTLPSCPRLLSLTSLLVPCQSIDALLSAKPWRRPSSVPTVA